jgi:hypothetical protein
MQHYKNSRALMQLICLLEMSASSLDVTTDYFDEIL